MAITGKSEIRVDAFDKATGRTKYYDDLAPSDALIVRVKHSTIAHGFVKSVDTSAAEQIPGVVKILTCFDAPDRPFPTAGHPWSMDPGHQDVADRHLLNRHVRYYGDDVCAVIAESEVAAMQAVRAIQVEYEELPFVLDVQEAMKDGAPQLHENYPDEDIDPFELAQFAGQLDGDAKALNRLLATCHRGRIVKDGLSAVILGSPNAGKSSLLNCLAGFDRVIVTDIPGTTRDAVEQTVRLGRHLLRLLDTAGIRETDDQIERMGVERSLAAAQEADLALFVVDGSKPFSAEDQEAMDAALGARACIALMNKTDLGQVIEASDLPFDYVVPISAKNGMGMELLEQAMDMLFADDAPCDGSLLTNARQAEAIVRARDSLRLAQRSMQAGLTPDAVLVDVEAAMLALGEVTGRTMREDITNRIFERFCVGK